MKCHYLCQHPTDTIQLPCVRSICNRFGKVPIQKRQRTNLAMEISSKLKTANDDQNQHETQQMFFPLYLDRLSHELLLSFGSRRSMHFDAKSRLKKCWQVIYIKRHLPYLWVLIQVFSSLQVRQLLLDLHLPLRHFARNCKCSWDWCLMHLNDKSN